MDGAWRGRDWHLLWQSQLVLVNRSSKQSATNGGLSRHDGHMSGVEGRAAWKDVRVRGQDMLVPGFNQSLRDFEFVKADADWRNLNGVREAIQCSLNNFHFRVFTSCVCRVRAGRRNL